MSLKSILLALECGLAHAMAHTDLDNVYDDHKGVSVSNDEYQNAIDELKDLIVGEECVPLALDSQQDFERLIKL